MMRPCLALVSLCLLVGCSPPSLSGGTWREVRLDNSSGLVLEFDKNSNRMMVHLPNKPDGTHDHATNATYSHDAGVVTVQWDVHGRSYTYTGSMDGVNLELRGEDGPFRFLRSEQSAH